MYEKLLLDDKAVRVRRERLFISFFLFHLKDDECPSPRVAVATAGLHGAGPPQSAAFVAKPSGGSLKLLLLFVVRWAGPPRRHEPRRPGPGHQGSTTYCSYWTRPAQSSAPGWVGKRR